MQVSRDFERCFHDPARGDFLTIANAPGLGYDGLMRGKSFLRGAENGHELNAALGQSTRFWRKLIANARFRLFSLHIRRWQGADFHLDFPFLASCGFRHTTEATFQEMKNGADL